MKNIHRVTYALAALVIVTVVLSIGTRGDKNDLAVSTASASDAQETSAVDVQKYEAAIKRYPTVAYDEAEPSDPTKRAARREKQKRYNNFVMVAKTPHPEDAEISFVAEDRFDFPGLPVEKSDLIVIGDVLAGEAHLSEDKRNIFSEFTVKINKVLNTLTPNAPPPGSQISIERIGGYVKYPNGQTVLYRAAGFGVPQVGGRFIFFLNSIPKSDDYRILTGYELGNKEVEPLDFSAQFEVFRGFDVPTFLSTLDEMLSKPSAH